jgi:hypothetical protein
MNITLYNTTHIAVYLASVINVYYRPRNQVANISNTNSTLSKCT